MLIALEIRCNVIRVVGLSIDFDIVVLYVQSLPYEMVQKSHMPIQDWHFYVFVRQQNFHCSHYIKYGNYLAHGLKSKVHQPLRLQEC